MSRDVHHFHEIEKFFLGRGTTAPPTPYPSMPPKMESRIHPVLQCSYFPLLLSTDAVRWSKSPTCLVDQHSALPDRTRLRIPPFKLSTIGGRAFPVAAVVLEQSARQRHVSQFVVGFPAATEAHTVPADIPKHYHVTFLNGNNHSGPSSKALLLSPPK